MNATTDILSSLQELLRQKMEEYKQHEEEGKSRAELYALYKELKDLRYQITVSNPAFRFAAPSA